MIIKKGHPRLSVVTRILFAVSILICFFVIETSAQAHNFKPGWCKFAKPVKGGAKDESASAVCLACRKEAQAEEAARKIEDKKQADRVAAESKTKAAAVNAAYQKQQAQRIADAKKGEVLINAQPQPKFSEANNPMKIAPDNTKELIDFYDQYKRLYGLKDKNSNVVYPPQFTDRQKSYVPKASWFLVRNNKVLAIDSLGKVLWETSALPFTPEIRSVASANKVQVISLVKRVAICNFIFNEQNIDLIENGVITSSQKWINIAGWDYVDHVFNKDWGIVEMTDEQQQECLAKAADLRKSYLAQGFLETIKRID